tara:strand:- start:589 stop:966 length:378 start_codon:yes stop_codon:yes gene_type:complete
VLNNIYKQILTPIFSFFSLFASLSTLICCALPVLFVTLGMGAVLAGFISIFPWIVVVSKYKSYVFVGAGLMLIISTYFFWQSRNSPCPSDQKLAAMCSRLKSINKTILIISSVTYLIGLYFAYLA